MRRRMGLVLIVDDDAEVRNIVKTVQRGKFPVGRLHHGSFRLLLLLS